MMKNILWTYRIFRIMVVAAGSILILNAECNALCQACLGTCAAVTWGINPGCSECMQTCINTSGCNQVDVNSYEKDHCQ